MSTRRHRLRTASVYRSANFARVRETIYVDDLPTNAPESVLTLATMAAGVPQVGEAFAPIPACLCVDIEATPISDSAAWVYVTYETPKKGNGGGGQVKFRVRDGASSIQWSTSVIPGEDGPGDPLWLQWSDGTGGDGERKTDVLSMTYDRPIRQLVVEGVVTGRPSAAILNAMCHVNSKPWQGKPVGYWKFKDIQTSTTDDKTFSISCAFETLNNQDWASFGVLRDTNDGKLVHVRPSDVKAAMKAPYEYGIIGSTTRGYIKAGLYPTADFFSLFGL